MFKAGYWMAALVALLVASGSWAGKTVDQDGMYLGNGFPSGKHYNLLIHGKKDNYFCQTHIVVTEVIDLKGKGPAKPSYAVGDEFLVGECPEEEGVEYRCAYSNVVNTLREFPDSDGDGGGEGGDGGFQILLESGAKGPGNKSGSLEDLDDSILQVTDACAGFAPDDPAIVRLPADKDGYAVYGRVLGKPTRGGGPGFMVDGREIPIIGDGKTTDDVSDDLWLIGVIDNNGVLLPENCDDSGCFMIRSDPGTSGSGVLDATDLTELFTFSGEVCYWDDGAYCLDGDTNVCSDKDFCCTDVTGDGFSLGDIEYNGSIYSCDVADAGNTDEFGMCLLDGAALETLHCRTYDGEWIFNISDFVNVLYEVYNEAYNVQIRFYPLPLKTKKN